MKLKTILVVVVMLAAIVGYSYAVDPPADTTRYIGGVMVDGVSTVIGSETVIVMMRNKDGHVMVANGTTVPTDATAGYAKGAFFTDSDVATGSSGVYQNVGTSASCNFDLVAAAGGGTIVNSDISATAEIAISKLAECADGRIIIGNASGASVCVATSNVTFANSGAATIAAGYITPSMMDNAPSDADMLIGQGTGAPAFKAVSGDATITNAGVLDLALNAVTSSEIFSNAIELSVGAGSCINTATATSGSKIIGFYVSTALGNGHIVNSLGLSGTTITATVQNATDCISHGAGTITVVVLEP